MIWSALTDDEPEAGPLAALRKMWRRVAGADRRPRRTPAASGCATWSSPAPAAQAQGRQVARQGNFRRQPTVRAVGRPPIGEPALQLFGRRFCRFPQLAGQSKDAGLAKLFTVKNRRRDRTTAARAWSASARSSPTPLSFPTAAPYFEPNAPGQGRPLTAGFHLMQGYFRDDGPLCELILDEAGRRELDGCGTS